MRSHQRALSGTRYASRRRGRSRWISTRSTQALTDADTIPKMTPAATQLKLVTGSALRTERERGGLLVPGSFRTQKE